MATITNPITAEPAVEPCPSPQDHLAKLYERFWRCRGPLQFTACLILGGTDEAERAVEHCWLRASRNSPHFEREGEFRSWLLRVLINEAVALLHKRHKLAPDSQAIIRKIRPAHR
jgi:DNA-directed RNA polymerase specialized sigma24 family protein